MHSLVHGRRCTVPQGILILHLTIFSDMNRRIDHVGWRRRQSLLQQALHRCIVQRFVIVVQAHLIERLDATQLQTSIHERGHGPTRTGLRLLSIDPDLLLT